MQSRILSKPMLFMKVVLGFMLYLALVFHFFVGFIFKNTVLGSSEIVVESAVARTQEQIISGVPMRLRIPGINVDSGIENVGLAPDGAMDVPKNRDNVGWFNLGSRPGENGAAVMAGHYGRKDGKGSVFDNLYKLRKGDKVYVKDDSGAIISFVVRESRRYDPKADVPEVFSSNDGKSHLNLITCEGVWDAVSKSYSERLVVFTDREE